LGENNLTNKGLASIAPIFYFILFSLEVVSVEVALVEVASSNN